MHCRCRWELHYQWPRRRSSPALCQGHGAHARARPPPRPPGADAERARAAPRARHTREPGAPAATRLVRPLPTRLSISWPGGSPWPCAAAAPTECRPHGRCHAEHAVAPPGPTCSARTSSRRPWARTLPCTWPTSAVLHAPRSCLAPSLLLPPPLPPFTLPQATLLPPPPSSRHLPPTSSLPTPHQNLEPPFFPNRSRSRLSLELSASACGNICSKRDCWPAPHRRREPRLAFVVKGEVEFRAGDLVRTLQ
eukprot:SM004537S16464  [mRNA]  locus=s4537:85:1065:- [translate_table: standard]